MSVENGSGDHKTFWRKNALRRFPGPGGDRVRKLAATSSRLADLALSFPALLFAISQLNADSPRRQRSAALVDKGSPLAHIARQMGVPLWMRRLPPNAFGAPLPENLPDSARFSRRIVNHIPQRPHQTAVWLDWILRAHQTCDEEFALWLASRELYASPSMEADPFLPLSLWAWYSRRPETLAYAYMEKKWHDKIGFRRAVEQAGEWLKRIKLMLYYGHQDIEPGWLPAGRAGGYEFTPLLRAEQLLLASRRMHNCADQFVDALRAGASRLYQVNRLEANGEPGVAVATLELRAHPDNYLVPTINQLRARHNRHVDGEIWQAAYLFLGQGQLGDAPPDLDMGGELAVNEVLWRRLWSPYWLLKDADKRLPLQPDERIFSRFDTAIAALELKADEKDWALD